MHCATLEIKAKVEYTLVTFMLSFCCPAGFWPYLPSISRSNALLLIFLVSLLTFTLMQLLPGDPAHIALGEGASEEQIQKYIIHHD